MRTWTCWRSPKLIFYGRMMRPTPAFRKPPMNGARRIARPCRNAKLGSSPRKRSAKLERAFKPAGAGNRFFPGANAWRVRRDGGADRTQMGIDRAMVAGLFAQARQKQGHGAGL